MDFQPGEIVVLNSGGPDMTVMETDPDTGHIRCWWSQSNGETDEAYFPPETIHRIEADDAL